MTIETTTLANGFRVVSHAMPHLETAALGVYVQTGARAETAGEGGAAHMLEHMAFKGTERRSARQIAEEIEAVGGSINAATSFESTDYTVRILKQDAGIALDILADILQTPVFRAEDLAREQDVVLQEIASVADQPDDIVFELLQAAAYPDQPLGRPILGTPATVRGLTPERLITYRDETYAAPRMVLGAAGAVDHAELVAHAERLFAGLGVAPERALEPARYAGGHGTLTRRFEQAHVTACVEAPSYRDDGYYAANIFTAILGGGISSRLFQEARERRGLCYDISAFYGGYADSGLVGVHAATAATQVKPLAAIIAQEWRDLASEGPAPGEIERARAQFKSGLLMSLESCEARAGQIARDTLIYGRPLATDEIIARIEAVDADAVRASAARLLAGVAATASVGVRGVSAAWRDAMHDTFGGGRAAA